MIKYAIFENLDRAKSILKKREIPLDDPLFLEIKKRLEETNRLGYIGWLIGLLYEKNQSKEGVLGILDSITQPAFKETSTWFTKNVVDIESSEQFTDQLNIARNRKLAKNMWLKFPSEQKKLIDWEDSESSALLVRLWDVRYENLLTKISACKTESSLIFKIKQSLSSINADLDGFKNICELNGINIVYLSYENEILIANVKDSNEVNLLASDSSWCIRDQSNFEAYNAPNSFYGMKLPKKQYVIINTDEDGNYRKIGFTVGRSISASHLWNDSLIQSQTLIDYVKNKGFDIKSLFIQIDQNKINEQWIIQNLKNKINFSNLMEIISTFKVDIKDRMGCWKYIEPEGIGQFYNKKEIEELSDDILFIKYLSNIGSQVILKENASYLLKVMNYLKSFRIKNTQIKIGESIDKLGLLIRYFDDFYINILLKSDLLLDGQVVYSKYEMLKKHGYTIKKYTPSLGDIIYISDREFFRNIGYITNDIIRNLSIYHKMGFDTLKECMDVFFKKIKLKYNKDKYRIIKDYFYRLDIPDNQSRKEIVDLYFGDTEYKYKDCYNIFDMETISDEELRENINLMPSINYLYERGRVIPIFKRILNVCGKEKAIKYFLKCNLRIDDSDFYLNGLFYDIIEYVKENLSIYYSGELGLVSLNKLNKEQIESVIDSDKFRIDLSKPEISEKIVDYNIEKELAIKNYRVFKGKLDDFFDVFYDKKKYKLYLKIFRESGNLISNETKSIFICECWLLLWLDGEVESRSLLKYFIDKYLKDGYDSDLKSRLIPVNEDILYSNKVLSLVKGKDMLISKCNELLEKPEKVTKNWNDIVIGICGSIGVESKLGRYDSRWVSPGQFVTDEIADSQLERFKDFAPEIISWGIFESKKFKGIWKIIKPGTKVNPRFSKVTLDAYSLSQALLDENPNTRLKKFYELIKIYIYNDDRSSSTISEIYDSCIKEIELDEVIDFIESNPNDRLNKKIKKYLVERLLSRTVRDSWSKRLIDLAMITLNKNTRISWGLEERPKK